jgi:RNA polymerase sigma-70 factor, ECF subfamily
LKVVEPVTDEQLLIEAAKRDPARFAELYENNFDRVYAFIARRVPDRSEAQDLTADVFHQALVGIGGFQWRGVPFAGWLLGIAANLIARRWQKAANQPELSSDELEETGIDGEAERHAMLLQFLDSLPADQRLVLIRRFVDQQSTREIAEELGKSAGAIKQLQFRALQALRTRARGNHD